MSNATTKPNHTIVNTKPNDGMKNAIRWESLLNALYVFGYASARITACGSLASTFSNTRAGPRGVRSPRSQ